MVQGIGEDGVEVEVELKMSKKAIRATRCVISMYVYEDGAEGLLYVS